MGSYLSQTIEDRREMLESLGLTGIDELFSQIPAEVIHNKLDIPPGLSEIELINKFSLIAGENRIFSHIFRGAGAYNHYIPAAVKRIVSNETFITAYTPYQSEISQGILQSIFEYQSMIAMLTGMDVSNASVYDAGSAAAEAMNMCRERGRDLVLVSAAAHPDVIETIKTYCFGYGIPMELIPLANDGRTCKESLKKVLSEKGNITAGLYIQSPNYCGLIEDLPYFSEALHREGAYLTAGVNPISLGILEAPGNLGADIAVGEGQPLGMPLAFGGPYLGFMACKSTLMRKLPGRIIGETVDQKGERAFVLTLQAREQHIRREKASSNICSNQAHCALTAAVYMSVMGEEGFTEASRQCHAKAVYAAKKISEIPGFSLAYNGEFFNEFVTHCPNTENTLKKLEEHGILGGLPLPDNRILWCVTEVNTKEDIDLLVNVLSGGVK